MALKCLYMKNLEPSLSLWVAVSTSVSVSIIKMIFIDKKEIPPTFVEGILPYIKRLCDSYLQVPHPSSHSAGHSNRMIGACLRYDMTSG